jgi:hypothetical protein
MPKNTADLSALLANQAGSTRNRPPSQRPAAPRTDNDVAATPASNRGRMLGHHVPEEAKRQFDLLAAELDRKKEDLHAEAINDLFAKYGKPELCPITGRRSRKKQQAA